MTVLKKLVRPLGLGVGAALLALGLAGCGGGTRVSQFKPTAITVFGDEASVIGTGVSGNGITTGYRYTVNAFTTTTTTATPPVTTTTFNCLANLIWVQQVAAYYGFGLPGCPLASDTAQPSRSFAEADSGALALVDQVSRALAQRAFTKTDLVTVYTGQNDVLALYATATSGADCYYEPGKADAAGPKARLAIQRGELVAAQVNRIAADGSGGRVLFVTLPSLQKSPFGIAETKAHTDFDRGLCLDQLAAAFNSGLRTDVVQDGRLVGLVQADEQLLLGVKGLLGFSNITDAVCGVAPPNCTTATLANLTPAVTVDTYLGYLWADDKHFSVNMHARIGGLAITRAENNPF
jgi:hypothetical protein